MIKIAADGIKAAQAEIAKLDKQVTFATAVALTQTAQLVKKGQLDVMRKRLDRPTPTTMKSIFVKPATRQKLEARVWFKDAWSSGVPPYTAGCI